MYAGIISAAHGESPMGQADKQMERHPTEVFHIP